MLVTVLGHVRWVHKPESVVKGENETVTFACKGEGDPVPDPPLWFKNGEAITGE